MDPIKLPIWMKNYPRLEVRFPTCTAAEERLAGIRAHLGDELVKFAIDKEVR